MTETQQYVSLETAITELGAMFPALTKSDVSGIVKDLELKKEHPGMVIMPDAEKACGKLSAEKEADTRRKAEESAITAALMQSKPPWERSSPAYPLEAFSGGVTLYGQTMPTEKYHLTLTEGGNAYRFVRECKDWLFYNKGAGPEYKVRNWYSWEETHWMQNSSHPQQAAGTVIGFLKDEVNRIADTGDDVMVKKVRSHFASSDTQRGVNAVLNLASVNDEIGIDLRRVVHHELLACKNGIFNTATGEWTPLNLCRNLINSYPVHYVDRTYTQGEKPEEYLKHLNTVFTDNTSYDLTAEDIIKRRDESVAWINRWDGYCLTAGNAEQAALFMLGSGANGKSVHFDLYRFILGGKEVEKCSLAEFNSRDSGPKPSMARANGKRIAYFSEASGGKDIYGNKKPISADVFKDFTGEGLGNDRMLNENGDDEGTVRLCKMIVSTNDMPAFDDNTAVLRRLNIIIFSHRFVKAEDVDGEIYTSDDVIIEDYGKYLAEKEGDAIFSFWIDCCREYITEGLLPVPQHCREAVRPSMIPPRFYKFLVNTYVPDAEGRYSWEDLKRDYEIMANQYYDEYLSEGSFDRVQECVVSSRYTETRAEIRLKAKKNEINGLRNAIRIMEWGFSNPKNVPHFHIRKLSEEKISENLAAFL